MRKIICILIALLVIVLLIVSVPVIRIVLDLSNPLRRQAEQIKESILALTPIDMSMDDVLKVIETNKKWEMMYTNYKQGISQGDLGKGGANIGEKSTKALIGKYTGELYFDGNLLHTLYTASVETYVSVFWAFDEESKLLDIYVTKNAAGF